MVKWQTMGPYVPYEMTEAERDAWVNPPNYVTIYNTDEETKQIHVGGAWHSYAVYVGSLSDDDLLVWSAAGWKFEPDGTTYQKTSGKGAASGYMGLDADEVGTDPPQAHKDRHDPDDGADPLDTATAADIAGVQSAGAGTSHSLARADHIHGISRRIADSALLIIDHEEGAQEGELLRFTEDGVEPRTPADFLQDLSGIADDPFDWNDQEIRNVRKVFVGGDRVEAKWGHAITVEDPAAGDVIPIIPFYEGRVTITDIKDGTIGGSTTADYNIEWRPTLNGTGTDVFASDVQATNTDADRKGGDFQSPRSASAGGWLVCAISAVSGTAPDFLAIGLRGTYAP